MDFVIAWMPPRPDMNSWPMFEILHGTLQPSTLNRAPVECTWRPPQTFLHYNALYAGIYEYLRAPPDHNYKGRALRYLEGIRESNMHPYSTNPHYIQNHRILWIQEWLKALPNDQDECSDAETVTHSEYEEVW
jgi:hypothetical protein